VFEVISVEYDEHDAIGERVLFTGSEQECIAFNSDLPSNHPDLINYDLPYMKHFVREAT
jgi:hypothetical protein